MNQPCEEREIANAAYLWKQRCQLDLSEASSRTNDFDKIEFAFIRFKAAHEREQRLNIIAADAERNRTTQAS